MKILVASKNPVKINATRQWFIDMLWDQTFAFDGISCSSWVSSQPMDNNETYTWALNRAKNARSQHTKYDFRVGIEWWVERTPLGMELYSWVVILSKTHQWQAKTWIFYLPKKLADLIDQWTELWDADDIIFWQQNSKQKNWCVWRFTCDKVDRTTWYHQAVVFALIPFKNRSIYR